MASLFDRARTAVAGFIAPTASTPTSPTSDARAQLEPIAPISRATGGAPVAPGGDAPERVALAGLTPERVLDMTLPELHLASARGGIPRDGTPPIAGTPPTNDKWPTMLGVSMTPENVTASVYRAHRGYMGRFCDLLSEQRGKVTHLQGVLSVREKAVSSARWTIVPADTGKKRKDAQAAKIADYVTTRFKAVPQFNEAIHHLTAGIYFGRSALETQWARDATGIGIKRFWHIHPKRLSFAADWSVHLYDEMGNNVNPEFGTFPGVDIRARFPDRFVLHQPQTTAGEYPTRQGVGYALVWTSLFYVWTTRDWMQYAELFGRPWRLGVWSKATASREDINALERAAREVSGATGAALPAGADLKLLYPGNAGSVHAELRGAFNAEISKVVLGQTGTTELGDRGSYAAVKAHDLVREDIKESDGVSASESMTADVVRPLVAMQFGQDAADALCPRFELLTAAEESIDGEFKRVMGLNDRSVSFDADEARDRFTRMTKPQPSATLMQPLATVQPVAASDAPPPHDPNAPDVAAEAA